VNARAFADLYASNGGALGKAVGFHLRNLLDELIFAGAMLQCPPCDLN
jgi:hypothetical protein